MKESKLRTGLVCIATSGDTVDGRAISQQELKDIYDTYDPNYYTANIWADHKRGDNLGQVLSLKLEQGETESKLYAVLSPTQRLIMLNKQGQYLYSSIEIAPNFRNSGKSYLFGLGVTDTPASVGTTRLEFSQQGEPQNLAYTTPIKNNLTANYQADIEQAEQAEQAEIKGFFHALKQFFTKPENSNHNQNKETEMNEKLLTAIESLNQKLDQFTAQPETKADVKPQADEKAEAVSIEAFNALAKQVQALTEQLNKMTEEATKAPQGVGSFSTDDIINVNGFKFNFGE
ncbi:GPO family capsid scaffolding protein [Seminibacterium arietis]|uniref:GPO family capsid scaffolding protein n=1 Tax=Seminibacterium arietis TaxID=1173502 RepID=A0ABW3I7R2_9PAST